VWEEERQAGAIAMFWQRFVVLAMAANEVLHRAADSTKISLASYSQQIRIDGVGGEERLLRHPGKQ
jgi:hypothetical protein